MSPKTRYTLNHPEKNLKAWRINNPTRYNKRRKIQRKKWTLTFGGFIYRTWGNMRQRCGLRLNNSKHYYQSSYYHKRIQLLITREQFKHWCTDHRKDWQKIINEGKKPSIDRIDSNKHYSLDNIRIIELKKNLSLGGIEGSIKTNNL